MIGVQKAWCWSTKGEPTQLELKDKPIRELNHHEVLIKNSVIGLNPVDWKLIAVGHPAWSSGSIPGVDGMGEIIAVGQNMQHLRLGTRVCYHTDLRSDGSFSHYTIVPGAALMRVPENISDEVAAALPCPMLTAWQALQKMADVAGKRVLVNGAGGSVGYYLTQLLVAANAKVYVTASERHHAELYAIGVAGAIDYHTEDWQTQLRSALHGHSLDIAYDTVSGASAAGLVSLLGYYGHLIAIQDRVELNILRPFTTGITFHEIALGAIHTYGTQSQMSALMADGERLLNLVANHSITVRQRAIVPFDCLPEHLAAMKKAHNFVKYLVHIE